MQLWKNRPLFTVCSIFMGTSLVAFFLVAQVKLSVSLLLLTSALLWAALIFRHRKKHRIPLSPKSILSICLLLSASLALFQSFWCIDKAEATAAPYDGQTCEVVATVTECRNVGEQISTYVLSVKTVNQSPVKYKALLTCYYTSDFKPGYEILLTADAISLTETAGDIYEEYVLIGDNIFSGFISYQSTDCTVLQKEPSSLLWKLARHRAALSAYMDQIFEENAAGLPSALLLGERKYLSDDVKQDFSRTGISHLLAISGLHMTMLFGMLALVLKLFRLRPRLRAVILGIIATVYLLYLGFPPSATRAIVMLGMTYLATLCYRGADPLTSLGLAGACILLVSPTTVADVGFWMSFSTTLGILAVLPLLRNAEENREKNNSFIKKLWRKSGGKLIGGILTGIVAMTFSLWITAPVMGEVSFFSVPMTLILTPLIGLLLLLSPLATIFASTSLGSFLITAVQKIAFPILSLSHAFSETSWAVIPLKHWIIPIIAIVMMGLILILLAIPLRRKGWVLTPMVAGWILIFVINSGCFYNTQEIQVSYLVPSTASEMLVMTQGQEAVICEISNGSRNAFMSASREAARQGATEIAAMILTDYHTRTSGSLHQLLQRETVRALWLPRPQNTEDYDLMMSCLAVAERFNTPAFIYDDSADLTLFGNATLSVQRSMIERSRMPVLLLRLQTPAETVALCGRSILESDLSLPALVAIAESDTVIFSNYGPKLKQPISCVFGPNVKAIYFANAHMAAYLSPHAYPEDDVTMIIGQGRITLP